jgi:TM2 domain-containing membrane protein YozV
MAKGVLSLLHNIGSFFQRHPIIITIIFILLLISGGVGWLIHWAFYDIDRIQQGNFCLRKPRQMENTQLKRI